MTDIVLKVLKNRYNTVVILPLDSFKYDGRDTLTVDFDALPTVIKDKLKFSVLHVQSEDSGIIKKFKYSNTDMGVIVDVVYHEFVECDGGKFLIKIAQSITSSFAKSRIVTHKPETSNNDTFYFNTNSYKGPK